MKPSNLIENYIEYDQKPTKTFSQSKKHGIFNWIQGLKNSSIHDKDSCQRHEAKKRIVPKYEWVFILGSSPRLHLRWEEELENILRRNLSQHYRFLEKEILSNELQNSWLLCD